MHTYTYALAKRDNTELRMSKDDGTAQSRFVWDDNRLITELDDMGSPAAEYTYEPASYGNLISQKRGTATHWYHGDVLGTTRALTDSAETVSDTLLFDAWGNILARTGTTETPFHYIGQLGYYYDASTGLHLLNQRFYNAVTGRFFSTDPIRDDRWNLYRYVRNRGLNAVDPSGLDIVAILDPKALKKEGHVAVLIGNDQVGWRYFSFSSKGLTNIGYPNRDKIANAILHSKNKNAPYEYTEYRTWKSTPAQDLTAVDAIYKRYNRGKYDLVNNNCTSVAQEALSANSIDYDSESASPKLFFKQTEMGANVAEKGEFSEWVKKQSK